MPKGTVKKRKEEFGNPDHVSYCPSACEMRASKCDRSISPISCGLMCEYCRMDRLHSARTLQSVPLPRLCTFILILFYFIEKTKRRTTSLTVVLAAPLEACGCFRRCFSLNVVFQSGLQVGLGSNRKRSFRLVDRRGSALSFAML